MGTATLPKASGSCVFSFWFCDCLRDSALWALASPLRFAFDGILLSRLLGERGAGSDIWACPILDTRPHVEVCGLSRLMLIGHVFCVVSTGRSLAVKGFLLDRMLRVGEGTI